MKITANKRDDILRRKAEYEEKKAAFDQDMNDRRSRLRKAEQDIMDPVKKKLEDALSHYSALQFDVRVERDWKYSFKSTEKENPDTLAVRIQCNENNKFSEDVALSWEYNAKIGKDGEVIRETGSWSGLKAATEAQMKSLRQTVAALEYLNDLDWKSLIDVAMPTYQDYYGDAPKEPEKEDFDSELMYADLEEIIGQDKVVEVENWGETCPYRGARLWLKLTGQTASQYRAIIIPGWYKTKEDISKFLESHTYENRIRKTSVRPIKPLNIMEV